MSDKIITIAKYDNYFDANMAKQTLEENGIRAFSGGENTANVYSVTGLAQASLQVFEKDAQKALEILGEAKNEDT